MNAVYIETLFNLLVVTMGIWLPVMLINLLKRQLYRFYGPRKMLAPALIGVPVHEASHLLVALLFAPLGHRVKKVAFFKPNQAGGLGFVSYQYRPSLLSAIANMFIGLAPLAGGILTFLMVSYVLVPDVYSYLVTAELDLSSRGTAAYLVETYQFLFGMSWGIEAWVWLVVSGSVIAFMTPSAPDFHGCAKGFILIYVAMVCLSIASPAQAQALYAVVMYGIAKISPYLVATIVTLSLVSGFAAAKVTIISCLRKRKENQSALTPRS